MKHFKVRPTECIVNSMEVICYDVCKRYWLLFWDAQGRFDTPEQAKEYMAKREQHYAWYRAHRKDKLSAVIKND